MSDARYAYHEAGHAVAAAVLGFPFRSSGIHIDHDGVGITRIVCPNRNVSKPFSDVQAKQTRMVIVLLAGLLAQQKFCPDPSNSAADDELKIRQYLSAIYPTDEARLTARNYLQQESERLVDLFWDAIKEVADTLWARECTPITEEWGSILPSEKTVGASVVVKILKSWNISANVDDHTPEDQPNMVDD